MMAATDRPAGSLPVSVAAATRGSRSTCSTLPAEISSVWNTPSGKPASWKSSSRYRAHCGTFEACLSRPTFPAIRAGAANRMACHNGRFHGITASTTPIGWYVTNARFAPTRPASASRSRRNAGPSAA